MGMDGLDFLMRAKKRKEIYKAEKQYKREQNNNGIAALEGTLVVF